MEVGTNWRKTGNHSCRIFFSHRYFLTANKIYLESEGCGIFLYTVWINVTMIGLIKKLTGQQLNRIKLGRRAELRMMRRRTESEELPAETEKQDGHTVLRKGTEPCDKDR